MLEATEQRYGLNKGYVLNFSLSQFESSSVMIAFSDCSV